MRLRVLPLPHSGDPADTATPYALILDEVADEQIGRLADALRQSNPIGSRGVLAFRDRVALPDVDPQP